MKNSAYAYCVVGNGPNAYLATSILLHNGKEVLLIDSDKDYSKGSNLLSKLVLKDRTIKKSLYAQGIPINHAEKSRIHPVETKKAGGLTNFWGGMFFPPYIPYYFQKHQLQQVHFDEILDLFLTETSSFKNETQNWNSTYIGVQDKDISKLIELEPQILTSQADEIWNVSRLFEKLDHSRLHRLDGTCTRIIAQSDSVEMETRLNNKISRVRAKQVLLACGPIGNAKLLANSMQNDTVIELQDSSVSYCITVATSKSAFMPNQMRAEKCGFLLEEGRLQAYYQYYRFSEDLIQALRFKFVRRSIAIINSVLGNRLGLLMIFQNDENSRRIVIRKREEGIELKSGPRRAFWRRLRILLKLMKNITSRGLFFPTIFFSGKPGDGAHSAGPDIEELRKLNNKEQLVQEIGVRVHLLGMSATNRVFAGPVTQLSLALTKMKVENLLDD